MWMGIGFGTLDMIGADIIMCEYTNSGAFHCSDRYANSYSMPTVDQTQLTVDIGTVVSLQPGNS